MVDRGTILAQLAMRVGHAPADAPFVARMCHACVEILDVAGAALTVGYASDHRVTLCSTDAAAARLEDLQEVLGEGPGWDASSTGYRVAGRLPSRVQGSWPMLSEAVRGQLRTVEVLALPLSSSAEPMGILTVYRDLPFPDDEQEVAQFVADAVGAAILRDHEASEQPTEPWLSRSRVHMATGMVVAQLGMPPDDALALIRAYAFAHDKSLDEVSSDIVERHIRLDRESEGEVDP